MMKSLSKTRADVGLELVEVPVPKVESSSDVKIKVLRTAICGTDLHIYKWDKWSQNTIKVPMVIGHEFCGEIVEMGSDGASHGLKVGDIVTAEGHIISDWNSKHIRMGNFHFAPFIGVGVTRQGCFAEYVVVHAMNVWKKIPEITMDMASVYDPFGNATHTALMFDLVGKDVLITGAGPIGIMAIAAAKFGGAKSVTITDINDKRLDMAKKFGADQVVNVKNRTIKDAMQALDIREGYDVGMEMSGAPSSLKDIISHISLGGKIAVLGIPSETFDISWNEAIFKQITIRGISGRKMFETWYQMDAMMKNPTINKTVNQIITSVEPFTKFDECFKTLIAGDANKIVLNWENA